MLVSLVEIADEIGEEKLGSADESAALEDSLNCVLLAISDDILVD